MEALFIVLAVVGGIAVVVMVVMQIQRQKYIKSLTERGWQFIDRPTVAAAHGLNCPPFGLGTSRKVDDQIIGTVAGHQFSAFEYESSAYSGGGYVVRMPLPRSLPEFYLFPARLARRGVVGAVVVTDNTRPFTAVASDLDYGTEVVRLLEPGLAALGPGLELSIDHDNLVALGAPREAEVLATFLEGLAGLAQRVASADPLAGFHGPTPPARLGLYQREGWEYRDRDNDILRSVRHTDNGYDHEARDVVLSPEGPLPFVTLTHHWKTDRTVTSTDSEGRTTSRTVTDHHSEKLGEFLPTFRFPAFKLNRGMMGDRIRFEWEDFNQRHTVRCRDPRLAHAIFHPRQLEYVMHHPLAAFEIDNSGHLLMSLPDNSPDTMVDAQKFLLGFFGRVPNHVWQDLGHQRPPLELLKGDI